MGLPRLLISSFLISLTVAAICPAAERWRFIMTCDSRGDVLTGVNEPILSRDWPARCPVRTRIFLIYPGDLVYGARLSPERFERQLWQWVRCHEARLRRRDSGVRVPRQSRGRRYVGRRAEPVAQSRMTTTPCGGSTSSATPSPAQQELPDNGPADARHMSYSVRSQERADRRGGSVRRDQAPARPSGGSDVARFRN